MTSILPWNILAIVAAGSRPVARAPRSRVCYRQGSPGYADDQVARFAQYTQSVNNVEATMTTKLPTVQLTNIPATPLAVRVGDLMQTGEDLRLALKLADTAIAAAERAGAPREQIDGLRRVLGWLRD